MKLHPLAWTVWLVAVAVFAVAVSDPLYVAVALGAVTIVHLSFPRVDGAASRAVRVFVVFGAVLLLLRVLFVALLPNPGTTVAFHLPSLTLPHALGALRIGGDVHLEVIVAGLAEGLRLIVVLAAFGVFNAHADTSSLLRSVPAAFRDTGLVVSIAFAFVPGMLRTVRDVRDAQRLRGEHGLRRLAPSLAVPVLGLSLERALLLAESMDARGYGVAAVKPAGRRMLTFGLTAMLGSVAFWIAGGRTTAAVVALGGAALVAWSLRVSSAASPTTRLARDAFAAGDVVVVAVCVVVVALISRLGPDATYNPYPHIAWPAFRVTSALVGAALVAPVFASAR